MQQRTMKWMLLAATSGGMMFQLGGCVGDLFIRIFGFLFLDTFLGPLVGDAPNLLPGLFGGGTGQ
jgi:hypothetical protein